MDKSFSLKIGSAICMMCVMALCGCWNQIEEEKEDSKSLNDIRFANFKDEDWKDIGTSTFIRTGRKSLSLDTGLQQELSRMYISGTSDRKRS